MPARNTLGLKPVASGEPVKESEMELFKNMEVAVMLSFGLLCAAACLVRPPVRVAADRSAQASPAGPMPVVVITGKRLSAEEKRALERQRA
jgi:hypothetical protein